MPNSKPQRRGYEEIKIRKGKLREKSMSFPGRGDPSVVASLLPTMQQLQQPQQHLRRPRTVPSDLPSLAKSDGVTSMPFPEGRPKLTKLLLNVTIQGSLGAVQVLTSPELTVGDLIAAAVRQYVKEGRRPVLPTSVPAEFDLHYSQFSLESLNREEKLSALGSRNFFLCRRKATIDGSSGDNGEHNLTTFCSKEVEKATLFGLPWLKFMNF
ncbi:hypothetical protein Ancab_007625 [Ancistrocladus abbreviatus]